MSIECLSPSLFGDLFVHMLSSSGRATLEVFTKVVRSAKSFGNLLELFKQGRKLNCGVATLDNLHDYPWLLARTSGLSQLVNIETAKAEGELCSLKTIEAIRDKILNSSKYGEKTAKVAEEVSEVLMRLGKYNIELTSASIERMGDIVDRGHGDLFKQFLDQAADSSNTAMTTFVLREVGENSKAVGLGRVIDGDITVMDKLLEEISNVPLEIADAGQFLRGLTIRTDAAIRGVYGEAASIKTVTAKFGANPDTSPVQLLQVTDWVKVKRLTQEGKTYEQSVQGIDQVYEIGSKAMKRTLYVESKLVGKGSINEATLYQQFEKHMETKIRSEINRNTGEFTANAPLIHYELRGTDFTSDKVAEIKKKFKEICERPNFARLVKAGFDCDKNISIEAYTEALHPIIN